MTKMATLFVGHGSPMNCIEDNEFVRNWRHIAEKLPVPEAILSVSAHWYTTATYVMENGHPKTIHDFFGFPDELYRITYPAPGAPEFARKTKAFLGGSASLDHSWGLDHGTWSVLRTMYPNADIPVYQVSINRQALPEEHYELGRKLRALRTQGVMIFGSGNVVHNLGKIHFAEPDGYDWAHEFDEAVASCIRDGQHKRVVDYRKFGVAADLAVPMPDHYLPLLYVLGASDKADSLQIYNQKCVYGSLSMTSYVFTE